MKLTPEVCAQAAKDAGQEKLWSLIGTDATVMAHGEYVEVALKDGRAFSIVRDGHQEYKLKGKVEPFATENLCELGKKFIQVVRNDFRGASKAAKVAEDVSKEAQKAPQVGHGRHIHAL